MTDYIYEEKCALHKLLLLLLLLLENYQHQNISECYVRRQEAKEVWEKYAANRNGNYFVVSCSLTCPYPQ